jgi:hypothetical protein
MGITLRKQAVYSLFNNKAGLAFRNWYDLLSRRHLIDHYFQRTVVTFGEELIHEDGLNALSDDL